MSSIDSKYKNQENRKYHMKKMQHDWDLKDGQSLSMQKEETIFQAENMEKMPSVELDLFEEM